MSLSEFIFQYPKSPLVRRHGPLGYTNPKSFKPWLRDEFGFRCVYCLWRERWYANGDSAFSVEHVKSRTSSPELILDYNNLVYACCRCNSIKSDITVELDPFVEAMASHLEVDTDGRIHFLSDKGEELVSACQLDAPVLTESRARLIDLINRLKESSDEKANALLTHYLNPPTNRPCLSRLRPPGGNLRPEGIV